MAGGVGTPYMKLYNPYLKRANLLHITSVAILCSLFYLLGVWQHSGNTFVSTANTIPTTHHTACPPTPTTTKPPTTTTKTETTLDFKPHHTFNATEELKSYPPCDIKHSEYTPCEDRERSLKFPREKLVYRERHCPKKGELMKCLVPAPNGYKNPFTWPKSRELAWFANVPHKELTVEKAVQNWIRVEGDKFRFPGGGLCSLEVLMLTSMGLNSSYHSAMVLSGPQSILVVGWGAYLLSRNIITMSFAPRDSHEAQVQFALERGVPAMIGVMASNRLPTHPAHSTWPTAPDGQFLIEVDRVLRPGGYWILSGPPINWKTHWKGWQRTEQDLNAEQTAIESVAKSLCWKKIKEKGDLAIWQKPTNHVQCKANLKAIQSLQFCSAQDPDVAWYTKMEICITPLPEAKDIKEVAGGELKRWPERLNVVPPRINSGSIRGVSPDMFTQDTDLWKRRLGYYKKVNNQLSQKGRYRNLLDMNARFGGFAAALANDPVWVMNVVPTISPVNTLGVIYERGLIGTYQDWCEAMSTYPRTYDLLHADSVFTLYNDRCDMDDILLEMDRILRPEGTVIFRDDVDVLVKVKAITDGMKWESMIVDHEDGPMEREKILMAVKTYWTAPPADQGQSTNPTS
ncbi:putative methyltransferase PMT15 [Acorus calamus]|uniref:Methyltransferase n=1 Tax=Acorus calamus TaxID=4465 RepID=A0AAV9DTK7_ACOCL|nr:putative methyltransferase PMT15 [Acorus calamus]